MSAKANRMPELEPEDAHHHALTKEVRRVLNRLANEGMSLALVADARESYRRVWREYYPPAIRF